MIGSRLAHYEITSHLGSGGMGDVYRRPTPRPTCHRNRPRVKHASQVAAGLYNTTVPRATAVSWFSSPSKQLW